MKKFAFTLAEVLITLGVIGVVASLTIPTFVSNSENRANASKLAAVSAAVENAFISMLVNEGVQDLADTDFADDPTLVNFSKYMKFSGADTFKTFYGTSTPTTTYKPIEGNGNIGRGFATAPTRVFQTKNGALIVYYESEKIMDAKTASNYDITPIDSIGRIFIDVNGVDAPNIMGRDVFLYRLGSDGHLYPAGGNVFAAMEKAKTWDVAGHTYSCVDGERKLGCTARLIEDNYKMTY